jgi:hypothetical protein
MGGRQGVMIITHEDGQIKAKEESNRWSWKIPKLELTSQGRNKHIVKKMKQVKLCGSWLHQICHVKDPSSSPHLNIIHIHIHIRSLINWIVVLLWDSQFLCQGGVWKAWETCGGMLEHKMGHCMNDEHHLEHVMKLLNWRGQKPWNVKKSCWKTK